MGPTLSNRDSNEQQPSKPKRKYSPQACVECQRRKRKCSGGRFCDSCRFSDLECVYSQSRSSKRRALLQQSPVHGIETSSNESRSAPNRSAGENMTLPTWPAVSPLFHDDSTLHKLRQDFEGLRNEVARLRSQPQSTSNRVPLSPTAPATDTALSSAESLLADKAPIVVEIPTTIPLVSTPCPPQSTASDRHTDTRRADILQKSISTDIGAGTSFFRQLDLLDNSVNGSDVPHEEAPSSSANETEGQDADPEVLSSGLWREAERVVEETRAQDFDNICRSVDIFFRHLRPHWPFINEANFRTRLAALWANDNVHLKGTMMVNFAALLNFVVAATQLLYDSSERTTDVPGWTYFFRGDRLLTYATWLEKSNTTTLQILLVKILYCFFAGHFDAAYASVGVAGQLCVQLGLHNEPSWGPHCTFYARAYRQRLFWSLVCLSPIISQHAGCPDPLRDLDIQVEYPLCVDDRMLYPDCLPLQELPRASPVPYLLEVIKWARLSSEAWDTVLGPGAKTPFDAQAITSIDNKVKALSAEAPQFLQWTWITTSQDKDHIPSFRWHQALIMYLRERSLRILLRRNDMLNGRFDAHTAQTCIEIAVDVVSALELSLNSSFSKRTAPYTSVLHLTGAIVPMICIIIRPDIDEALARPAIDVFKRSLSIIREYAPAQSFARLTLKHLNRPIRAASQTIRSRWPQHADACVLTPETITEMGSTTAMTTEEGASNGLSHLHHQNQNHQLSSWGMLGQMMVFPKPATATINMDPGLPLMAEEFMVGDEYFTTTNQDPFGGWHAGHMVL
ncbi:hypothetical protein Z517_04710 [Fonsecaea pedrosoi CBS 271.37]|uniref:Zn(2)-C6 fungal-type domain-containing protein n=1 Tax=Fonsecaea pedrosoi CBS 271.37 TaxID=1442368 RepID=A0A0D2HAT9_9EURO|nr:uncharacterized protein Z517_04710 [Fonsecaea pedrosoi CBS 271.37]KIW81684.1 hypothetical protein Z517_04710 [Fonsecaea pedrosoi CBS 271.37]